MKSDILVIEKNSSDAVTDPMRASEASKTTAVSPLAEIVSNLEAVEWDFTNRTAHSTIEGIHPYPAKFVSDIPRKLLEILPVHPGTSVFDPFCGSGTTLVEAQRLSLSSIGVDLNPIACLQSKVKTRPLPKSFLSDAQKVIEKALTEDAPIPSISNVDHWFRKNVQHALASLIAAIQWAPKSSQDALKLALSSIIVRVSNQESDTRYAAIEKNVSTQDVFDLFLRACKKIASALSEWSSNSATVGVLEADILKLKPSSISSRIGLTITSPPYPNAYEYWLYHKYRMWWLGFDPIAVKKDEIGARAHFFKKNHHTADDFLRQMRGTLSLISSVTVRGGYACFVVVGRSRIHGEIVDNAKIIDEVARDEGFEKIFEVVRVLSANRKSFNLSHANIKTENIIVFQKGDK